jgi:hypothetical protein
MVKIINKACLIIVELLVISEFYHFIWASNDGKLSYQKFLAFIDLVDNFKDIIM